MKKYLLIFLFVVLSNGLATRSWGQMANFKNDSEAQLAKLREQLKQTKEDTSKVPILMQMVDMEYRMGDNEKAIQASEQCLAIAQKIGTFKYLHRAYAVAGTSQDRVSNTDKALYYFQKSLEASENGYPAGVLASCLNLAGCYQNKSDHKKVLFFARKGIPLAQKQNKIIILNDLKQMIADVYRDINKKDSSIILYKEIMLSALEIKDTFGLALACINISNAFDNEDSSIFYSLKAIRLSKIIQSPILIQVYNNMAMAYEGKYEYNQAILYLDTALIYSQKPFGSVEHKANVLLELGRLYYHIKNYTKSQQYYEQSLIIYKKYKLNKSLAATYARLAALYEDWGKYDEGLKYILLAIPIYKEIGETEDNFDLYNLLGSLYYKQGKITQALQVHRQNNNLKVEKSAISLGNIAEIYLHHFKDSLPIAKKYVNKTLGYVQKYNQKENIITYSLLAAQIDSALGDYKGALAHYKIYAQYADSLRNKDNTSLVYEYEAKYDNQKLRAEKAEADKNIAEEKAAKQKLWFAVVLAASLSVAGFVAYWQQRKRKVIAEQLRQTAEQTAATQVLLAEESKALAEANAQRVVQEQEIAQQNEELLVIQESRNTELAKEKARWLNTLEEINQYLDKQDYKTMRNIIASHLQPEIKNQQEQLESILSEIQQNFPDFIPNLIAKHPELASKPKLQDLAILLAQNIPISDIANFLFNGQVGTAKNNQRDLRVILDFPAKDYDGVRNYLRVLMQKK